MNVVMVGNVLRVLILEAIAMWSVLNSFFIVLILLILILKIFMCVHFTLFTLLSAPPTHLADPGNIQ